MTKKKAIIAGAGPAGLTAAYELLERTDITPHVFEMTLDIGGISKTVNYKNNRIDIGGHRFFSKSKRVMSWWKDMMPLQGKPAIDDLKLDRDVPLSDDPSAPDPQQSDDVMLIRNRLSRIYFLRSFFNYPVALNLQTIKNLGIFRMIRIGFSYILIQTKPIKPEKSLEDFLINRFGKVLYRIFFKDYTEKVWGVPCDQIKPEWGAQRIKGLSIRKALLHALKSLFKRDRSLDQKNTETSLIEQFMYPKLGPGQLWEKTADLVTQKGGQLDMGQEVKHIQIENNRVTEVVTYDAKTGKETHHQADYFFSSMPVKHLIRAMGDTVPEPVKRVAEGLIYRDFLTVGLLLKELNIKNKTKIKTLNELVPDNWIYIQEREVRLGRLQIFNNWSPYMVDDLNTSWVGLEYFCNDGDDIWSQSDEALKTFGIQELASINIIKESDVLDATVIRMPKAYPAYFGTYDEFQIIRDYVDQIENMFLIGRNGMHRYNNSDHSMLTAMVSVDNICKDIKTKDNIWSVNTESTYHEEKSS